MSWASELCAVYETQCGREDGPLAFGQTIVKPQIEVTLREDGTFVRALPLPEGEETRIPVTEKSAARTSGSAPMPFADELQYLAGDFGDSEKERKHYSDYTDQLRAWAESEYTHAAVGALYAYIQKGCLMRDLLECGVLQTDPKTGKPKAGQIFGKNPPKIDKMFVRFRIEGLDEPCTWEDPTLQEAFLRWFGAAWLAEPRLCCVTGRQLPPASVHPRINFPGQSMAKPITANEQKNDKYDFTYRGRFRDANEALCVSYEASQELHQALRWLIKRQGISVGSMQLVVWASALEPLPDVQSSAWDDGDEMFAEPEAKPETVQEYAQILRRVIYGDHPEMDLHQKVMLLALDPSSKARLAIRLYSELQKSDFLDNLYRWHEQTACYQRDREGRRVINSFALREILRFAYGREEEKNENYIVVSDDDKIQKIQKESMLRLIACITQGARLPKDIVMALVAKASRPMAYHSVRNHTRVLTIACGLIRKYHSEQGGITAMAYDREETDRSYLYGCLLAIAEAAEKATYEPNERDVRATNARRYMTRFSQRPFQTWGIIEEKLQPYLTKLGKGKIRYERMLGEVMRKFDRAAFEDNSALSPSYLLGYHHYTDVIYTSTKNEEEKESC